MRVKKSEKSIRVPKIENDNLVATLCRQAGSRLKRTWLQAYCGHASSHSTCGEKEENFTATCKTMHPIPPKCWLESQLIDGETNPNPCVDRENIRKEESEREQERT